tara:strand:+ start:49946 stop:50071 length:126 start_codon:yes stop_codon:yes gene_type:complete
MDTKQTLIELLDAIQSKDWERAEEFLGYLSDWLSKGGYSPV